MISINGVEIKVANRLLTPCKPAPKVDGGLYYETCEQDK